MITVRHASEDDLRPMLGIYNDIILHTTAVYDYEPHTLEMRTPWFRAKKEQGFPVYVAVNQRGKGIGKLLMPPLIEATKEMKMHTIIAGVDTANEASIKLHEHFGFKEVAHFKEVGWKFDRWLDLKFLQLIV